NARADRHAGAVGQHGHSAVRRGEQRRRRRHIEFPIEQERSLLSLARSWQHGRALFCGTEKLAAELRPGLGRIGRRDSIRVEARRPWGFWLDNPWTFLGVLSDAEKQCRLAGANPRCIPVVEQYC